MAILKPAAGLIISFSNLFMLRPDVTFLAFTGLSGPYEKLGLDEIIQLTCIQGVMRPLRAL